MSDRQPSVPSTATSVDQPSTTGPIPTGPLSAVPPVAVPRSRRWRKHPLTRLSEGIASAFFFALTVLPVYAVIADGKDLVWLVYAAVAAVGCYLCIADAVRQETRSPVDEEEAKRRFDTIIRELGKK